MYYAGVRNHTDLRHIERAIKVAQTSTMRFAHGVVIAQGSRVLSVGVNTFRNSPLICTHPDREAGYHAETQAIRGLSPDAQFSKYVLYSARIMRSGKPGNARPCARCQEMIDRLGFKKVIWTV